MPGSFLSFPRVPPTCFQIRQRPSLHQGAWRLLPCAQQATDTCPGLVRGKIGKMLPPHEWWHTLARSRCLSGRVIPTQTPAIELGRTAGRPLTRKRPFQVLYSSAASTLLSEAPVSSVPAYRLSRLLGFFCFSLFCWLSSFLPADLCETRTQSQHISSHVYACRTLTALPRRPRCPRRLQRLRRPPPRVFMCRLHSYQRTIKAV
jgi:hypothetical protein